MTPNCIPKCPHFPTKKLCEKENEQPWCNFVLLISMCVTCHKFYIYIMFDCWIGRYLCLFVNAWNKSFSGKRKGWLVMNVLCTVMATVTNWPATLTSSANSCKILQLPAVASTVPFVAMPIRYDTHIFACVIIFLAATKAKVCHLFGCASY